MTSAFSWQNTISLCPDSFRIPRPYLPVTPGVFLTSYFCIPVPYNEKDIFWGCQFLKVLQVFMNRSTSASSALLVGVQTWITVILNSLPWKQTEIIPLFLRLHPSTAFQTLLLTMRDTSFFLRCSGHSYRYNDHLN